MLMGFVVSPALADQFTFDIGMPNAALSGYVGPYASVVVDLDSSGIIATITATGYFNATNTDFLGDGGSICVNVNATSWT